MCEADDLTESGATKNPSKIYSVKSTIRCKLSRTPRKGWDNGHEIVGSRVWLRELPGW
jgi:hypothetical protein